MSVLVCVFGSVCAVCAIKFIVSQRPELINDFMDVEIQAVLSCQIQVPVVVSSHCWCSGPLQKKHMFIFAGLSLT